MKRLILGKKMGFIIPMRNWNTIEYGKVRTLFSIYNTYEELKPSCQGRRPGQEYDL